MRYVRKGASQADQDAAELLQRLYQDHADPRTEVGLIGAIAYYFDGRRLALVYVGPYAITVRSTHAKNRADVRVRR